jgi:D-allulose-6-phosphate 3-epimerase
MRYGGKMYKISTSMMCADPFLLETQIKIIDQHTDYYHIDIMDGHFVPNITLSNDYVKALKKIANKPIDIHLMVTNPEQYIDELISIGVNCISFHPETVSKNLLSLVKKIKSSGIKVGFALKPKIDFEKFKEYYKSLDKLIIMTVEPGFAGQKMIKDTLLKIKQASNYKKQEILKYSIEIDGSNNFETFNYYKDNGSEIFILGSKLFSYKDLNYGFTEIKNFIFNNEYKSYVLGIDVGGTYTRFGVVDLNGQCYNLKRIETLKNKDDFNTSIINYIKESEFNIQAISIGFPGLVNTDTLEVISLPNLKQLEGKDYLPKLLLSTGKRITLNKDTNCLLINDLSENKINTNNAVAFYLGTGFGNAMLINGKLHNGNNFSAGEIGHLRIYENNAKCGCGQTGCVETFVSGKSLREINLSHFPDSKLDDIFSLHSNEDIIVKFIKEFAKVVAIEVNLLDIDFIIIGGGVPAMKNFPKKKFEMYLKENLRISKDNSYLKVIYSSNKIENGVIGAAKLAFRINGGKL